MKERITDLMDRLQSTDDAESSMGVNADETEEMIGAAVRDIDELSKNLVTRNNDTAVQDALDRLNKNHVAESGKLDMCW